MFKEKNVMLLCRFECMLVLLLAFFHSSSALSNNFEEQIILKNRSLIKGDINEIVWQNSIKMIKEDGSLLIFDFKDIAQITVKTDSVYLNNGSYLVGNVLEIRPGRYVKCMSADGSYLLHAVKDVDKIIHKEKVVLFTIHSKVADRSKKETSNSKSNRYKSLPQNNSISPKPSWGFRSAGGHIGFVKPEKPIKNTLGLGLNMHIGELSPELPVYTYLDFWSKGYKKEYTEYSYKTFDMSVLTKLLLGKKIDGSGPYIGAGIGLQYRKKKEKTNSHYEYDWWSGEQIYIDAASETSSHVNLNMNFLMGTSFKVSPTTKTFFEFKYNFFGVKYWGMFAGISYYNFNIESKRKLELVNRLLEADDYVSAFKICCEVIRNDVKNIDAIALFPDVFDKACHYHLTNIENLNKSESWDEVPAEYCEIDTINGQVNSVKKILQASLHVIQEKEKVHNILTIETNDVSEEIQNSKRKAAEFHFSQAETLKSDENYRDACIEYEKALHFVPNYNGSSELLKECRQLADDKDAQTAYADAADLVTQKKYRDAVKKYNQALSFIADFKDAKEMAHKYRRLADEQDAQKFYKEGLGHAERKMFRKASEAFNAACNYVPGYKDAVELAGEYLKLANEQDAQSHYAQGMQYAGQCNYRAAIQELRSAASIIPGFKDTGILISQYKKQADEIDAERYYQNGLSLMGQNKYQEAQSEFVKSNEYVRGYKDAVALAQKCKSVMPTENQIEDAVMACLKKEVPIQWVGNLMGGHSAEITSVRVNQIGNYNDRRRYWPMRIKCKGSCLLRDPFNQGKKISFNEEGEFMLYKDDYGTWKAELRDGIMQGIPKVH